LLVDVRVIEQRLIVLLLRDVLRELNLERASIDLQQEDRPP